MIMRTRSTLLLVATLLTVSLLRAQIGTLVAGASGAGEFPIGSFHDRFKPAAGVMVYFGQRTSPNWLWMGKVEYFELATLNTGKLFKTVGLQEGTGTQVYQVPLNKLSMRFRATGFTAEAMVSIGRWSMFEANAHIGFGFYNWEFTREAYNDSLQVLSRVTGLLTTAATLAVPKNRQTDWSGSFNLGCSLDIRVMDPVCLTVGADYRLIVAELWPALDLDMEGVSGLQSVSFRAGINFDL
jgi:hypothetical protein